MRFLCSYIPNSEIRSLAASVEVAERVPPLLPPRELSQCLTELRRIDAAEAKELYALLAARVGSPCAEDSEQWVQSCTSKFRR